MITSAKRMAQRAMARHVRKASGLGKSVLPMSGTRSIAMTISDPQKLPCLARTSAPLQNSIGQFFILTGYSDPLGPDV